DITELKNLELMRKDFVANVSHELKTPITSIKGFAETLLDGAMDEEKSKKDFLEIIYQESDRLQLLIEDLLTLSNLERDVFELTCSTVDISMLLEEITPIINQQSLKHHVDYTVEADDNLTVQADKEKLKQVIINLVDKDRKSTRLNSSHVSISYAVFCLKKN